MRCACIDIGSNTTRVLVADVRDGRLEPVVTAKAYTRLGRELRRTGALPPGAVELVAAVVAQQRARALEAGAERIRVVATAAIRAASDGDALCAAVRSRAGTLVEVLTGHEEARLAFAGATRTLGRAVAGTVAVVDVGGGSSEIAVGTGARGVVWWASVPVGSGSLLESCLITDPPGRDERDDALAQAWDAFAGLAVPAVEHAIAVGGSATSTARLVGAQITPARVDRALDLLCAAPAQEVARRHGLDAERVRLLPGGLHLLSAASRRLERPLEVGRGGLREGVCLELGVG